MNPDDADNFRVEPNPYVDANNAREEGRQEEAWRLRPKVGPSRAEVLQNTPVTREDRQGSVGSDEQGRSGGKRLPALWRGVVSRKYEWSLRIEGLIIVHVMWFAFGKYDLSWILSMEGLKLTGWFMLIVAINTVGETYRETLPPKE